MNELKTLKTAQCEPINIGDVSGSIFNLLSKNYHESTIDRMNAWLEKKRQYINT